MNGKVEFRRQGGESRRRKKTFWKHLFWTDKETKFLVSGDEEQGGGPLGARGGEKKRMVPARPKGEKKVVSEDERGTAVSNEKKKKKDYTGKRGKPKPGAGGNGDFMKRS